MRAVRSRHSAGLPTLRLSRAPGSGGDSQADVGAAGSDRAGLTVTGLHPPDGAAKHDANRGGDRLRAAIVAVLAAAVVAGGAVGAVLVAGRPDGGTGRPAGPPLAGAEAAQLASVAAQLERSARARAMVTAATQAVGNCTMTPGRGITVLNRAIRQRLAVGRGLRALPVAAVPAGPALVVRFETALQLSITADHDFIGWMQDMRRAGSCPVSTTADVSYQAGLRTSSRAVAAESGFLSRWNPLARRAGQPAFTSAQI